MSEVSPVQDGSAGGSVTTVVRAHIKPGKEPDYEEWLHGINEECSQFSGFQGATVFRPDDDSHPHPEYVIVVRLATYSDLRRWEGSQATRRVAQPLRAVVAGRPLRRFGERHGNMLHPARAFGYGASAQVQDGGSCHHRRCTLRAGFHTVPDCCPGWGRAALRRGADNLVCYVNRHDLGHHAFVIVAC